MAAGSETISKGSIILNIEEQIKVTINQNKYVDKQKNSTFVILNFYLIAEFVFLTKDIIITDFKRCKTNFSCLILLRRSH